MNLSALDKALWATSLLCHVALLLMLVFRRRATVFPVFTAFVASEAFRTVLLFLVLRFGSKHGYFLAYWITGFLNYAFRQGWFSRLESMYYGRPGDGFLKHADCLFFGRWSVS